MKAKRTSRFTSWAPWSSLICLLLLFAPTQAQEVGEQPKPTKYVVDSIAVKQTEQTFFQGFTLSADVLGPILKASSDYGVMEGALRLNLKNTYFPIVEAGYAICETTNEDTHISYKTKAPFLRAGLDINMLKDKWQDNKLYIGARYGISAFSYDISGPAKQDPIWGGSVPIDFQEISTSAHWIELVAGVQVKIWRNFHMGWSVRFKSAINKGQTDYGTPYYIPGYGTTTSGTCWGATYNLSFDLNWGKKKKKTTIDAVIRPTSTDSTTLPLEQVEKNDTHNDLKTEGNKQ